MSEIRVENEIVMRKINTIKPYIKNPRKNDKTVDLLCKIIPKVGFNVPLVIDSKGVIVKGHARFCAAMKLGIQELPCIITHADPDAIRADRIADNKVSEFSEWINEELMHEVDMLDLEYDFSDMGLPRMTYDDIPSLEDFGADVEEDTPVSDEDKMKIYQQFLEQQAKANTPDVSIVSERDLQRAVQQQAHIPAEPKNYGKCICKRCGNVMYVDKSVMYTKDGTVRR